MNPRDKEVQFRQLEALAQAKIGQAEQQKVYAGQISPEVVAEVYRLGHQMLALLEDRQLNTNDPNYLLGLFTALLKLHKSNLEREKTLYGHPNPQTVGEIARLEYLIAKLRDTHSAKEPGVGRTEIVSVREGLQRLLT